MTTFRGVFPAIITPMTASGDLHEAAFREVMEFNIQAGVHGFWVAGGTGESVLLDDTENMRLAEIAADQSRGRIANIMHVAPRPRPAPPNWQPMQPGRELRPSAVSHRFSISQVTTLSSSITASWRPRRSCRFLSITCLRRLALRLPLS